MVNISIVVTQTNSVLLLATIVPELMMSVSYSRMIIADIMILVHNSYKSKFRVCFIDVFISRIINIFGY